MKRRVCVVLGVLRKLKIRPGKKTRFRLSINKKNELKVCLIFFSSIKCCAAKAEAMMISFILYHVNSVQVDWLTDANLR